MAKKDYSKLSKEELIALVEKLESRKKYGLVWDEERTKEQFEKESENALPVLKEIKSKEIKTDPTKPTNILIEGDNYHALSVLNYTHQGKIDVIYIDPPYNTGNKSWKYNNEYVEKDDAFKHSKWLSFMSKRLRLAKNLLKDDGIMMVAIDDYECHTLRLLIDEIFGEDNRLGTIVVVHNPGGRSDDKFIATS
ncbi:MAG TPA: site-specific DNA-methyltransferase, partial [bacterium]|nr:site-specific DNA-methyltransferase [bacterium]